MRGTMLALTIGLMMTIISLAQNVAPVDPANAAKAQEILKQAREAIGDEAKLKALRTLSATGSFRRTDGGIELNGEIELDLILPDKVRAAAITTMGTVRATLITAINGEKVWQEFVSNMGVMGGGNSPQGQERLQNLVRADLTRWILCLLVTGPSSMPLEYNYAGEAQAPSGKADVIDVTGANRFSTRLFFDQKTQRLLMLSYRGRQPMLRRGVPGGRQGQPNPPVTPPEEQEKRSKETNEATDRPTLVEMRWMLADYKEVGGINLPHRVTKSEAGTPNEEWVIDKYKINPQIKPEKFEKK